MRERCEHCLRKETEDNKFVEQIVCDPNKWYDIVTTMCLECFKKWVCKQWERVLK